MATSITHDAFFASSSSSSKRWRYDVFLNFRGDTRKNFTGHLYMRLEEAGINTFIDDRKLRKGTIITEELMQGIEGSRISVIIFSRRYGNSRWCLEELVEILGCRKRLQQIVLPIFYDVAPTDVRNQTGSFGEEFDQTHKDIDNEKVKRWRDALYEAANLSGWDLTADGNEAILIKKIVDQITQELPSTNLLSVARHPVGIDSRLQDLSSCLHVECLDDVCMIGILGMGGTGKTTIARAIYNKFFHEFQGKVSFLENVGETTRKDNGLVGLQNQLLFDMLKPTKIKVGNAHRGMKVIEEKLSGLRALVIIDDIDDEDQLNKLAGNTDWFGPGSRIIITTRDAHLLKQIKEDSVYLAQPMNEKEALELFSWHAFGNSYPKEGYFQLSTDVVSSCGCLQLALEVIGSFLFGKETPYWEWELEKLKRIPDDKVLQKLKSSYDGLSNRHREKDIFLDIACFFIGMDRNYVTQILDGCDFFAGRGIRVLLDRCLITVSKRNKLMMHDCLRDMGREIVRESYLDKPENHSRLWHSKDVEDVLTEPEHTGTEGIEGLSTQNLLRDEEKSFSTEAFTNMKRLRLLQLNHVKITGEYKYLSKKLRWLCWHGCPWQVVPNDFNLRNLVVIDLQYSKLTHIWVDPQPYLFENLKILNLSHSHELIKSPDFSWLPNLEQLILKDCKSLCKVHRSIGNLRKLSLVNLKDSRMLKVLPRSFCKLKSIETLVLSGCSRHLAESLSEMLQLRTSIADEQTAVRNIPIPSCIVQLEASSYPLKKLYLGGCNLTDDSILRNLWSLSLDQLDLGRNAFHSLTNLSGLKVYSLILNDCTNLRAIADLPTSLIHLSLNGCTALEFIPKLSYDSHLLLEMWGSHKLIEIAGFDNLLNRLASVQIQGHCNTKPSSLAAVILKVRLLMIKGGGIFHGNEIPGWCNYVNYRGRAVSFKVPFGMGSSLLVYFVYTFPFGVCESNVSTIVVVNHSKRIGFIVSRKYAHGTRSNGSYLWLGVILNHECPLECGESVSVRAKIGNFAKVRQSVIRLADVKPYIPSLDCVSIPYEEALEYFDDEEEANNNHSEHVSNYGKDCEVGGRNDLSDEGQPPKRSCTTISRDEQSPPTTTKTAHAHRLLTVWNVSNSHT